MKVLLIGDYPLDEQESMRRFTDLMQSGLEAAGQQVRVLRPKAVIGKSAGLPSGLRKWAGYADKYLLFESELRAHAQWADVVHLCVNPVYTAWMSGRPTIVTSHDILPIRCALGEFPDQRVSWSGRRHQDLILKGLSRADHIVCPSEATRQDLLRLIGHGKRRCSVVYLGLNFPYSRLDTETAWAHLSKAGLGRGPFLLHVGGNQWYKNRPAVVRIFREILGHPGTNLLKLVLAGKPCPPELRLLVANLGLRDRVVELVSVSNGLLQALYSNAEGLLFPSLQEGFGWPIIEAQACGCPVFTTGRTPMTEVGGEAAIYIDPERPDSAAALIAHALPNSDSLRQRSLANAARFTTDKMISGYVREYEHCLRRQHVGKLAQAAAL